ncbi:MAG: hypothetical protein LAP87_06420 [Acidobacteriia bacterium]|nr:hypothetical protein [Terriglobia bacterium]
MMELVDTAPDTNVAPAEYLRLLGYPRGWVLEGRACELAAEARAWYREHGRPWVYAREARGVETAGGAVRIDGAAFGGKRLRRTLQVAESSAVMLVAASAGPEIEQRARELWLEEKPDEYFFLEMFGSAVVEHLTTAIGGRLCVWAEERGLAVLPHDSPGYAGWDVSEQPRLLELLCRERSLPGALEALESGALRPKKSQLAVFGLTRQSAAGERPAALVPCRTCSLLSCQYRRAPYGRAVERCASI